MTRIASLPDRGVLEVSGRDRVGFLQGLVSNDVATAALGRAVWAALLTPQGKWLADFFIMAHGEALLLDCERAQLPMLIQRLGRFRLRAAVALADRSEDWFVHAAWDGAAPATEGTVTAPDPRLAEAGSRVLSARPLPGTASWADWDRHRLGLGLPDGSRDLEAEKSVLLEAGFDELGGISWTKGCYMGQELTARTRYRGLVKRRLVPVRIGGAVPAPGTPVFREAVEVGTMRSAQGDLGLALVRPDALGSALSRGAAGLAARVPGWMRLPEHAL